MKLLGNLIWFILGGFLNFLSWSFVGILWSITIIGLPIGRQCFKFARLSLAPFGKKIIYSSKSSSLILNILWLIFGGLELFLAHLLSALFLAITIIGLPFASQQLKFAKLALSPFGAEIV